MASSQNTAVGAYTCTGGDARAAYVQQKDYKKQEWPNRSVLERFSYTRAALSPSRLDFLRFSLSRFYGWSVPLGMVPPTFLCLQMI